MSALDEARALDKLDDCIAAIQGYERALQLGEGDRTTFVDLAVLYFTVLDPGVSAALHLDQGFLDTAWTRQQPSGHRQRSFRQRLGNCILETIFRVHRAWR